MSTPLQAGPPASPPAGPSAGYDHRDVEARWYAIWEKAGYFHASDDDPRPVFSMVIPPPNITGGLHMGHALSYTIEDIVTRWHRMRGDNAMWLPGTDHAGIATQMVVERELKKEGIDRQAIGREVFVQKIWEWKARLGGRITEQMREMGWSLDWERERFTLDEGLSKTVRHVFVRLYEEGLIYRAEKLINWCPRCQTAISDLEVDHREEQGKLWHIAYGVEGSEQKLTVATTRPETLLGDTGVAVHPDDPRYQSLIGKRAIVPLVGRHVPIVADAVLVSMEFGTGVVKVTPAHDFNDFETGVRHKLERISILDEHGRTNQNAGAYAGLDRFEAREKVLEDLTARGLLVKTEDHQLSIGHCQRCGTIVEPHLSKQWFVTMAPLAKPAIEVVERGEIRIFPDTWKATYFHWMRNIHDWCISRQLWWGHQIPAWHCVCGEIIVAEETPESCPDCGASELKRDPDVLDTWFSSALWPFSTLGWPEKTAALARFYPTTLMETGSDILFFWVARMIMMGLKLTGRAPFRDVYLHAMVRDEHGEKMSKTKGNVIDPLDVTREHGADALRFALSAQAGQGRDVKLSLAQVAGYRTFCNKIWNASRFALMNLGDFPKDGREGPPPAGGLADRWIRSRLAKTADDVNAAFEAYKFSDAASAIYQFFWRELCDWYIELAKVPLQGGDPEARRLTQRTLVDVLDGALRLLHPFMPFVTEEIWQKLPRRKDDPASVMIADYPRGSPRDGRSEREMELVMRVVEAVRTIRGESNIPPGKRISATLYARHADVRASLHDAVPFIRPLAQLSELAVLPPRPAGERLKRAAMAVLPEVEIAVPLTGLVDFAEEERRLRKDIAKAEGDRSGLQRKLDNPSFVARAPLEVVEKDRGRIVELGEKLRRLGQQLAVVTDTDEGEQMNEENRGGAGDGRGPGGPQDPGSAPTPVATTTTFSPTVAPPIAAPIQLPPSILPPGPIPLPAALPPLKPAARPVAKAPARAAKRVVKRAKPAKKKAKAVARRPTRKSASAKRVKRQASRKVKSKSKPRSKPRAKAKKKSRRGRR
jgi:valyl-tRNA synthetase